MPLFHFSTRDAMHGVGSDSCDLPDLTVARHTAVVFAGDALKEIGGRIYDEPLHIVVTDDAGRMCWDLTVSGVEGEGAARRR